MADDFEFDDFDDDEGSSIKFSSLVERKIGRNEKRRLDFDSSKRNCIVMNGQTARNVATTSPGLPSSPSQNIASIYSRKVNDTVTNTEPGTQTPSSSTKNDEKREKSPNHSHRCSSRDGVTSSWTVSPNKRVHFDDGSSKNISQTIRSPPSNGDSVSSGISVSQSISEDFGSIASKSGQSCQTSPRSPYSASVLRSCSSKKYACNSSMQSTHSQSSNRSPRKSGFTKRSMISNLRQLSWKRDFDEVDEDNDKVESKRRRKRDTIAKSIFVDAEKNLIGKSNVSLHNTGCRQLLHDECVFLCNTLIENYASIVPDRQLQLRMAFELLNLLSSQETRRILFFEGQMVRDEEDSPLDAILNLIGSFDDIIDPLEVTLLPAEEKSARLSLFKGPLGLSENTGDLTPCGNNVNTLQNDFHLQQVIHVVGMIAFLIATDCTISDTGLSESMARCARAIRHAILSHPRALRGILNLVRVDPIVSSLRLQGTDICVDTQTGLSSSGSLAGSSVSSSYSLSDPTKTGRLRRRKRQLFDKPLDSLTEEAICGDSDEPVSCKSVRKFKPEIPGRGDEFDFDGLTGKSKTSTFQQNLEKLSSRVIDSLPSPSSMSDTSSLHTCWLSQSEHRIVGDISHSIPLVALARIIRGKLEWCEKSCLDVEVADGSSREFGSNSSLRETTAVTANEEEDEDDDNPLIQTNNLLGESGCLPFLSRALTETLAAILWLIQKCSFCQQCFSYLYDKFSTLTSLVDDACLMNDGNRELLSREGYSQELESGLVTALSSFLKILLDRKDLMLVGKVGSKRKMLDEMVLETLRSLTSLTHDNAYAAKDFSKTKVFLSRFEKESHQLTAVDVISRILFEGAMRDEVMRDESVHSNKIWYDSIIFCLNILTNCVESSAGAFTSSLQSISVPVEVNHDKTNGTSTCTTHFIDWLAEWLVSKTTSFREAISSFGMDSKHCERRLDTNENEQLVTAGNGFVLLASILACSADDSLETNSLDSETINGAILTNLPGNDNKSKIAFIQNLLTVFCNFYQVSIGDLSVAVTGPIKELIKKLDSLE